MSPSQWLEVTVDRILLAEAWLFGRTGYWRGHKYPRPFKDGRIQYDDFKRTRGGW